MAAEDFHGVSSQAGTSHSYCLPPVTLKPVTRVELTSPTGAAVEADASATPSGGRDGVAHHSISCSSQGRSPQAPRTSCPPAHSTAAPREHSAPQTRGTPPAHTLTCQTEILWVTSTLPTCQHSYRRQRQSGAWRNKRAGGQT